MRVPNGKSGRPAIQPLDRGARGLFATSPADQQQRSGCERRDHEPLCPETIENVSADHGGKHELSSSRLREERAHQNDRARDEAHASPEEDLLSTPGERERERQAQSAGESQLVRVLQDSQVAHSSSADRGRTKEANVLAGVLCSGLDLPEIAGSDRVARSAVGSSGARLAAGGWIDDDAAHGRKSLVYSHETDEEDYRENRARDDVKGAKALDAVSNGEVQRRADRHSRQGRHRASGGSNDHRKCAP